MSLEAQKETYFMEQNTEEIQRLSYQHDVVKGFMGSLVLAPLDLSAPNLRILDSATADGLWLRDLRSMCSGSNTYIGTDITESYFPPSSTWPRDLDLRLQSITKPWPADLNATFDLVHQRFALPAAGKGHMQAAVINLVALAKPGAWVQFMEADCRLYGSQ